MNILEKKLKIEVWQFLLIILCVCVLTAFIFVIHAKESKEIVQEQEPKKQEKTYVGKYARATVDDTVETSVEVDDTVKTSVEVAENKDTQIIANSSDEFINEFGFYIMEDKTGNVKCFWQYTLDLWKTDYIMNGVIARGYAKPKEGKFLQRIKILVSENEDEDIKLINSAKNFGANYIRIEALDKVCK